MKNKFKILDHPADIGIEAYGTSLSEAFQNAAIGLMSIIIDLTTIASNETKKIIITAAEKEQLLVKWLSEILYLYDGQGFVCREFNISQLNETTLNAEVKGETYIQEKHRTKLDVKAVTYHQLKIEKGNGKFTITVFFDI